MSLINGLKILVRTKTNVISLAEIQILCLSPPINKLSVSLIKEPPTIGPVILSTLYRLIPRPPRF